MSEYRTIDLEHSPRILLSVTDSSRLSCPIGRAPPTPSPHHHVHLSNLSTYSPQLYPPYQPLLEILFQMDGTIDDDFILIDHPCRPPTTSATSTTPSYLPTISTHINTLSPKLRDISLAIHDNPELNYEEFKAYELLVGFFKGLGGWKVEEKACGIETAFIAVFENGGREEGKEGISGKKRVVSFNTEYGEFCVLFRYGWEGIG